HLLHRAHQRRGQAPPAPHRAAPLGVLRRRVPAAARRDLRAACRRRPVRHREGRGEAGVAGLPGHPRAELGDPPPRPRGGGRRRVRRGGAEPPAPRHYLELYREGDEPVDISGWGWAPNESGFPESLWGTVNNGSPDMGATMVPGLAGLRGAPPPPAVTGPP